MTPRRSPCELEIDLFCSGIRLDPTCHLEHDARAVTRTRAGLGSGLELVIPSPRKDIWLNVPVEEDFARRSPYRLFREGGDYVVADDRTNERYDVRVPPEPAWYQRRTSRGTPMSKVGVLQGTYLGIYISNSCLFWYSDPPLHCRFCTTGANVGVNEVAQKHVRDVVEVARAAKKESGVTFVHLNSGYQAGRDLALAAPYVAAIKEEVGALVGIQLYPHDDLEQYDRLIELGVDHFSFCYEFQDPETFARYLPGKAREGGQERFFRAIEYTAQKLGKGAVSGEIIAGVEPVDATLRAIDTITALGAFPTVCIFRPLIGAEMERHPSPRYEEMRAVFAHVHEACRRHAIPIGLAPNIEVSLIVQPDDARDLAPPGFRTWLYDGRLAALRLLARPLFAWKSRRRRVPRAPVDWLIDRAHVGAGALRSMNGEAAHATDAVAPNRTACDAPNDAALRMAFETIGAAAARFKTLALSQTDGTLEVSPLQDARAAGDGGRFDGNDRCRLKVFRPREGGRRLCAFFYKRSNLAWSHDRFSYGAVEFQPERLTAAEAESWLAWLEVGFDPEERPERLRRAFLFSIPD